LFTHYVRISAKLFLETGASTPALQFLDLLLTNFLLGENNPDRLPWWKKNPTSAADQYRQTPANISRDDSTMRVILWVQEQARETLLELKNHAASQLPKNHLSKQQGYLGIALQERRLFITLTVNASRSYFGQWFLYLLYHKIHNAKHADFAAVSIIPPPLAEIVSKFQTNAELEASVYEDSLHNEQLFGYLVYKMCDRIFTPHFCSNPSICTQWLRWAQELITPLLSNASACKTAFTRFHKEIGTLDEYRELLSEVSSKLGDIDNIHVKGLQDEERAVIQEIICAKPVNCVEPVLTQYSGGSRHNFAPLAHHKNFDEEKPCSVRCLNHAPLHYLVGDILRYDLLERLPEELNAGRPSLYWISKISVRRMLKALQVQGHISREVELNFSRHPAFRFACQDALACVGVNGSPFESDTFRGRVCQLIDLVLHRIPNGQFMTLDDWLLIVKQNHFPGTNINPLTVPRLREALGMWSDTTEELLRIVDSCVNYYYHLKHEIEEQRSRAVRTLAHHRTKLRNLQLILVDNFIVDFGFGVNAMAGFTLLATLVGRISSA